MACVLNASSLLVSIVGIVIIAVALAGLLTELGSLSNPADAQQNEIASL